MHRPQFIDYSAYDAVSTWLLHQALDKGLCLSLNPFLWFPDIVVVPLFPISLELTVPFLLSVLFLFFFLLTLELGKMDWATEKARTTMRDYYASVLVPFGETLTDMERRGIKIDTVAHLPRIKAQAEADRVACLAQFKEWAVKVAGPEGALINPQSTLQMQTLLFGGYQHPTNPDKSLPTEREIQVGKVLLLL